MTKTAPHVRLVMAAIKRKAEHRRRRRRIDAASIYLLRALKLATLALQESAPTASRDTALAASHTALIKAQGEIDMSDVTRPKRIAGGMGGLIGSPADLARASARDAGAELLEVCERLMGFALTYGNPTAVEVGASLFRDARAAIAKARGQ